MSTHTTRYLPCHDFSQKVGLVKTLLFRANSKLITNYRDKTKEILSICNVLRGNDNPDWLLNRIKKEIKHKKVNKSDHISKEKCKYVGLPYFEGLLMRCLEFYENSILAFILTLIIQLEIFTSVKSLCGCDT